MKNLAAALFAFVTASAAIAEDETTSAHVYQAVVRLGADVDLVREVMGRPESTAAPWIVVQAQPRHLFYQALTLLRKSNLLAAELVSDRRMGLLPAVPEGEIHLALVLEVVERASAQIGAVRGELGISYRAEAQALDEDAQPADVLREIVQISRQLNFLVDRRFSLVDVYNRLELAATYVAGALTEDEAVPTYGELSPFESGKVPADVYRRVLECLELATVIGEERGIDVLKLNLRRELRRRDIAPTDVYDLATTLLAEVAYLTLVLEAKDVDAPPIERPKHIFPSHVYQVAGMLQDELARLEERQ